MHLVSLCLHLLLLRLPLPSAAAAAPEQVREQELLARGQGDLDTHGEDGGDEVGGDKDGEEHDDYEDVGADHVVGDLAVDEGDDLVVHQVGVEGHAAQRAKTFPREEGVDEAFVLHEKGKMLLAA